MRVTAGGWQSRLPVTAGKNLVSGPEKTASGYAQRGVADWNPSIAGTGENPLAAGADQNHTGTEADRQPLDAGADRNPLITDQTVSKGAQTASGIAQKIMEAAGKTSESPAEMRKKPGAEQQAKARNDTVEIRSSRESEDEDILLKKLQEMMAPNKSSDKNSKVKSSMPDDSVGELASMLARAETRMDVQQVASKAMRALTNLKMAAAASEGNEAKKIAAMIKRMEKLIKRIQKKLQHLSKEEQIERQSVQAEKKDERKKAEELRKEVQSRRKRRRRDERNYAAKERYEDAKAATAEMVSSMTAAMQTAGSVSAVQAVGGIGAGGTLADFAGGDVAAGAVSLDVMV